jgi:ribosome-associated protein
MQKRKGRTQVRPFLLEEDAMLRITDEVALEDWELVETFHRASGPGGQNVNKVATAVALRFEAARSPSIPPEVKARLRGLAGRRWTADGAVVITSERFRSQALNREDARRKLADLVRAALAAPRRRVATRPTRGSIERRLTSKAARAARKAARAPVAPDEG